jgi:hypothetical protein
MPTHDKPRPGEPVRRLPADFMKREADIIAARRHLVLGHEEREPRAEYVGLALSGGGVRSATFNVGVLQALATHHVLGAIDYLSTVSGGGFAGTFLGRFYTWFINRPEGAVKMIEARLKDVNSPEISWLRRSSEYVAAAGVGETPVTTAVVLRSFFTVHLVVGVVLLTVFTGANFARYGLFPMGTKRVSAWLAGSTRLALPVDLHLEDPWLLMFGIVIAAGVLPLMIAFWLPSEAPKESYQTTRLAAFVAAAGVGFMFALRSEAWLVAASLVVTTVMTIVWIEWAWSAVGRRVPGASTHPVGRVMVRSRVSKWLAVTVSAAAVFYGLWMLDAMVLDLYNQKVTLAEISYLFALSSVLLLLPLRWLAVWVFAGAPVRGRERGLVWRVLTGPFVLPLVLGVPLLIGWNFVSHAMFAGGADWSGGWKWMLATALVTLILGGPGGLVLVNRSSAHSMNAARGSRAYLGASNPYRHATEVGADLTSPQPDDDLPFDRYRPDLAGGPLHLINVFVNESVDRASWRRVRDRQGVNMAVGPVGISVGPESHGVWAAGGGAVLEPRGGADRPDPLEPRRDGSSRPWVLQTTPLQLSEWMALSGAILSSNSSAETRLGTSLLYGLSNVRSGMWWDSGIEDGMRDGELVPSKRIRRWLWRRFRTQLLLLAELTGRYFGPWRRYWYLSDGGRGDDLALYELVRRRVPIIICSDATRDLDGGFAALAHTMRMVSVDFGATIEFLTQEERDLWFTGPDAVPSPMAAVIGTLDDLRCPAGSDCRKHAAIARIRYEDGDTPSVLLYFKATMTGDEPVDVLDYRLRQPRFPHQSVLNRYLDGAQWESYRELGLHCAAPLFAQGDLRWLSDLRRKLGTR